MLVQEVRLFKNDLFKGVLKQESEVSVVDSFLAILLNVSLISANILVQVARLTNHRISFRFYTPHLITGG